MEKTASLTAGTNAILKLDLSNKGGGVRRIPLAKIWDTSLNSVSFTKLSHLALNFINCNSLTTLTYKDKEDDEITISTNDELTDAFLQFVNSVPPTVLRAKAHFDNETNTTAATGGTEESIQAVLDSFIGGMTQAVDSLSNTMDEAITRLQKKKKGRRGNFAGKKIGAGGKKKKRTEMEQKMLAKKLMNEAIVEVSSRKMGKKEKMKEDKEVKKEEEKPADVKKPPHSNILPPAAGLDHSFIHGRHTCDGCLVTPIIGLRYHALNLPDHDLCQNCIKTSPGSNIMFEPTELERDRYLQPKWKRRQWRQNRQCGMTGAHRRNNMRGDAPPCVDSALKEAIRRSLSDVTVNKEEKNEVAEVKQVKEKESVNQEKVSVDSVNEVEKKEKSLKTNSVINEEEILVEVEKTIIEEEEEAMKDSLSEAEEDVKEAEEIETAEEVTEQQDSCTVATPVIKKDEETECEVALATIPNEVGSDSRTILESVGAPANPYIPATRPSLSSNAVSTSSNSSTVSTDEWQLLDKDGDVSSDEMIAQAAQLLGSALFQSDVISDVTISEDTVAQVVSSVPTEVLSVVPSVLLSRWDVELKQMRELGFLDDAKNVDALEHLEAAKMGVDDKDAVTVNEAINYLLKK